MPEDQSQNEQIQDDSDSEPVFWRRKDVADFFGVSLATARKIIARPGFPKPFRAGGCKVQNLEPKPGSNIGEGRHLQRCVTRPVRADCREAASKI